MAVPEQIPYKEYVANGVTKVFSLEFDCKKQDHLIVKVDDAEPSVGSWSLSSGAVVFNTAPANGKKITIQRSTPVLRSTNFQSFNNSFRPETLNEDLDSVWLRLQEEEVSKFLLNQLINMNYEDLDEKGRNIRTELISELTTQANSFDQKIQTTANELNSQIIQQGVSQQQLQNYYSFLQSQMANLSSNKNWVASLIADASGKNQQEVNDGFDSKLKRENTSVWDFFTGPEMLTYSIAEASGSLQNFDAYRPLQAFADYIAAKDVGTAYCSGTLYTTRGILLGGAAGCATKAVIGRLNIRAKEGSAGHTLFAMQCGTDFKWVGSINPTGLGGGVFNNRTWRRGLVLGGEYQCAHTYINSAYGYGFLEYGVLIDNLTTSSDIADIRVSRCGSGYKLPSQTEENNTWSDKTKFTLVSENITTGTTQSSTIQVEKLPLTDLRFNPTLYIAGDLYHVSNIDYEASQITFFPLLNRNLTSGIARYVFGGGVCTAGSDASTVRIGKINATNCSVIYHSGALYPATIYGTQTGQSNFIDVLLGGNSVSQAHVGGAVISLYCEDSTFNIVRRTRAQLSYANLTNVALNLAKIYDLTRVRNPTTNELDKTSVGLEGIMLSENGRWLIKENRGIAANDVKNIDVTDTNRSEYWHYGISKTFNILAPDMPRLELLGYNRKSCIVMGPTNAGNPTGDIIFNAPAGYTVNGQSSVTFKGFMQAAKFDVYLQYERSNFVVFCATLNPSILSTSVTYDPESLSANEIKYWNVTLTGAKLGDMVACSFDKALNGTRIWAEVTSANLVTVYHQNPTSSVVDLVVGILKVKLL